MSTTAEGTEATASALGTQNADIVRAFIESFWNSGDESVLGGFLSADYVEHAYRPFTVDGLLAIRRVLAAAFPDQRSAVESIIAQGDMVVARLVLSGTHLGDFRGTPATGKPISVDVFRQFRLTGGKIHEHWALLDTATLLRSIGAPLDPPTKA